MNLTCTCILVPILVVAQFALEALRDFFYFYFSRRQGSSNIRYVHTFVGGTQGPATSRRVLIPSLAVPFRYA